MASETFDKTAAGSNSAGDNGLIDQMGDISMEEISASAREAANFLKAMSHEGRLLMLYHLSMGERSVSELENLMSWRQAAVSQQLARLRIEGMVDCRRDGKTIHYRLGDKRVKQMINTIYGMFCARD